MIPKNQWEAWALSLSGARVQEDIIAITRYHRIPGSQGYLDALEIVRSEFRKAGFDSEEVYEYPADGKHQTGMWRSSEVWELKNASLEIIAPNKAKGVLIDACVNPITVAYRSSNTPPEGIEATVVDVGDAESARDFMLQDVPGGILLARPGIRVWTLGIAQFGAAGILFGPRGMGKIDSPDLVEWNQVPQYLLKGKSAFAFQLSERQYRQLKDLVAKEKAKNQKVRVRAILDVSIHPGNITVFSTVIKGQKLPDEEILLVAHLCHPKPSANDNASGVAAVLELARVWKRLISQGRIPPPARTIRFLILPEWSGSIPWVQAEVIAKNRKIIAALVLDMVGSDQEKAGSTLTFDETPVSLPSFVNDRMESALERAACEPICQVGYAPTPFRWERVPFQGGSDHLPFVDPGANIPALCLTEWPDRFYHSSGDTVDKTNPVVIHRTMLAVAQVAMELANADILVAESFRLTTAWAGQRRLLRFAKERLEATLREIRGLKDTKRRQVGELWQEITQALAFHLELEQKALNSAQIVVPLRQRKAFEQRGDDLVWELGNLAQRLKDHLRLVVQEEAKQAGVELRRLRTWTPRPDTWTEKAKDIIPKTTFQGPFSYRQFMESFDDKDWEWYQELEAKGEIGWNFLSTLGQLCTWMDGKRSLLEIHRLQSYTGLTISLQITVEFIQILKKQGWVTF